MNYQAANRQSQATPDHAIITPEFHTEHTATVRIAAVVPALNEAPAIADVVRRLRSQQDARLDQIIVVDNGSTDGTGDIAHAAGATVVREERRGYGYACLAGILAANEAGIIVLLDGDAADDPSDLPLILEPILAGECDLVVGSRSLGFAEPGSMSPQQIVGNRLASFLIQHLYGMHVTDLGPLRAIKRDDLLRLQMQQMSHGWSVEMMVKAARAGLRYREVPVGYHRRIGVSKVGGTLQGSLRAGWCIVTTTFRYLRWTSTPEITRTARGVTR